MKDINPIKRSKLTKVFKGHKSNILAIDISSDNLQCVTGSEKDHIKVWKVNSENRPFRFIGHKGAVNCVKFDSTDKIIVSGGKDGQIILWKNSAEGKHIKYKGHSASVRSISFSIDNKLLISSSNDKIIKIWNIVKKSLKLSFNTSIICHNNWVLEANLSPDCFSICSIDTKNIKIWNTTNNEESFFFQEDEPGLTCAKFNKAGNAIAVGNKQGKLRLWDTRTSKLIQSYNIKNQINSIDFHPSDNLISVACNVPSGLIHFIDLQQGRIILSLENLNGIINSICFSEDGTSFAFCSNNCNSQIWSIDIEENNGFILGGETQLKGDENFGIVNKNVEIENKKIVDKNQENSENFEKLAHNLENFVYSINILTNQVMDIEKKLTNNEQRTNSLLDHMNKKKEESMIKEEYKAEDENLKNINFTTKTIDIKIDDILEQVDVNNLDSKLLNTISNLDLNSESFSFKNTLYNTNKIPLEEKKIIEEENKCVFDEVLGESLKKHEKTENDLNMTFGNTNDFNYTKTNN